MQVSRTMKIFLYVLTAMFLMTSPPVAWSFQGIHHHHSIIRKHKSGVVTVPLKLLYKAYEDVSVRTRLLATTGTLSIENGDDFGNIRKTKHNPGKSKKVPTLLRGLEESPRREGKELQVEGDAAHSVPVVSVESKRRGRPRSGASSKLRSALSNDALLLSGADVDKEDDSVIALGNKEGKIPHLEKDRPVRARGRPRSVNSGLVSPSKGDKEDVEGEEEYGRAMHVLEPGEEDEYYFQDEDEEDLEEEGFDLEEDEEPSAERDAALPAVGRRSRRRKLTYVGVDGLPIDRDYSDEEKEWLPYIYLGGRPRQQEDSVAASDGDSDCYQQVLDSHLYGHVQPAPWRVQVVSVVTNSSNNSTALECVEKIYAHIRQAFPDDPRLDFQTLCLVEGDCKPFAELEGVVQMWLEGYNTHHLVDGASMKEVWGGVVPHILLSDANLQAIVDTVAWALEESELQGTLLSPRMRNLRLRGGKPTVEGGFNTQEVESDFSTVQIR